MNQNTAKSNTNPESNEFAKHIDAGLSKENKYLSSKYFYDEKGDDLFTQIMGLEEYYLTRSEFEIFSEQKAAIFQSLPFRNEEFDLVELGSGDGCKTKILLEEFMITNRTFHYLPIDISSNSLELLKNNLDEIFPIEVKTFNYQYLEGLKKIYEYSSERPKLILFLGSNIGNLQPDETVVFLKKVAAIKNPQDVILLGIDLKKDPTIIHRAYSDSKGITASFNLNLLDRINRELGGDFVTERFYHYASYDPLSGAAKSYIVSKMKQEVSIKETGRSYQFHQGETIFTEISQKYSLSELKDIANRSGLELITSFQDSADHFADVILK